MAKVFVSIVIIDPDHLQSRNNTATFFTSQDEAFRDADTWQRFCAASGKPLTKVDNEDSAWSDDEGRLVFVLQVQTADSDARPVN